MGRIGRSSRQCKLTSVVPLVMYLLARGIQRMAHGEQKRFPEVEETGA